MRVIVLFLAGALLAACAEAPGDPLVPGVKTESQCRASGNPMRCKLENDLAGGPPIGLGNQR